jgi:protein-S-isoprenylcysteine O-methyltransferase Ste14
MLRGFILLVVYLGSLVAILFLSFGSVDWPMGWASLGIYIAISLANFFLVDPELVRERSRLGEGVQKRDRLLASISSLFLFPVTVAIAGIDVGRLGWSPPLPLSLRLLALLLFTLGNALGRWAMATNRFFSTFVRIQEDRSHAVVTGGPYRYVRHPGYAGAILAAITLPLALGSLPAKGREWYTTRKALVLG